MFVGHFAVGFAAKRVAPKASIGTLLLAALFADALWVVFLAAGVEHVAIKPGITVVNALDLYDFSISHSLAMDIVWGVLFAGIYFWRRCDSRAAWAIFAAVLSHWVLDFASHRPDMPLAPGVHRYFGLGLWNSAIATLLVEGLLWIGGLWVYIRATRPVTKLGTYAFSAMIVLLTLLWLGSLGGTPPPSVSALTFVNVILFVIVLGWAYWIDRLRPARIPGPA